MGGREFPTPPECLDHWATPWAVAQWFLDRAEVAWVISVSYNNVMIHGSGFTVWVTHSCDDSEALAELIRRSLDLQCTSAGRVRSRGRSLRTFLYPIPADVWAWKSCLRSSECAENIINQKIWIFYIEAIPQKKSQLRKKIKKKRKKIKFQKKWRNIFEDFGRFLIEKKFVSKIFFDTENVVHFFGFCVDIFSKKIIFVAIFFWSRKNIFFRSWEKNVDMFSM